MSMESRVSLEKLCLWAWSCAGILWWNTILRHIICCIKVFIYLYPSGVDCQMSGVLLPALSSDVYCTCKPAPHRNRRMFSFFFFLSCKFDTPVCFVCCLDTCLTCTLQVTQHGCASTLSTSGSCSWCRTAEMSSLVAREVTNSHKHAHV